MLAMSTSCGASFPRAGKPIAGALTELSGLILCAAGFVPKLGHFPEYMRIVQDEQGRILVARQEKGLGFLVRGKQGVFGVAAGFRSGGSLPHGVLPQASPAVTATAPRIKPPAALSRVEYPVGKASA